EDAHRRRPRLADPQAPAVPAEAEGFLIEGGRIRLLQPEVFAERPVAMIGLFHLADRLALDIHPEVLRALAGRLGGIDQRLRADPQANRLFLEILTSRHKPETALRRMNESGVLGRFVPEFGRVIAQMQYDMYHVYTVDEHAIRAIGLLSRIEKGELAADHPLSDAVVHKVLSRRALYLGLFLHDIGKGRGVDHSEFGATVALKLGPRLGLSAEETETAAWLVRHHLSFSHTAFKRDISDPKTVEDFVALVQSPERLRLLLVLTVADIRAVGPGRWNGWKGQLLRDLYHAAEAMLSGGLAASGRARRVEEAHAALRERMADWPEAAVRAHAARCEDAYWLSADADTHARHARFIARAEERQAPVAIDTRIDRFRAITEVTLFAPDQVGLFARATGALTLSGATIVDAKIFTTIDGMALDTFLIQGAGGGSIDEPAKLARLREAIARALTGPLTLDRPLPLAPRLKSRTEVFTVAPRVLIDNGASHLHTVVEVNGRDRPGLLFDLARALTGLRLSIASAHIATFGERAVDVFYVKDRFGLKVTKEDALVAIRERLLEALAPPPPSPRARISGRPAPPLAVPGGAPSTR
ncbi:MAG: [protein-PII] uridylyltransferase, partial [Alphaproteobacteria bacterium]|nr:[protein-PII] uridylyltransferase [Alphaproteobacteria bacterium]